MAEPPRQRGVANSKAARRAASGRAGVTLVELLIVIAVIGILIALTLPAVFSVREAGRRHYCMNNLRNIALGIQQHLATHGHYPTGGWGYTWVGDPDRGYGVHQPGGWIYSVLPFIEQADLRELGRGQSAAGKREAAARVCQSPITLFQCPTRAGDPLSPYRAQRLPFNAAPSDLVAKSDYAINGGDHNPYTGPGPETLAEADSGRYRWPDFSAANGISYQRSTVRSAEIRDGTSKTYLVGEKCVSISGVDAGHDHSMFTGHDYDTYRWTFIGAPPFRDDRIPHLDSFGSAHSSGFNMAFADGSGRLMGYDLDERVHRRLGNRKDGQLLDLKW